MKKLSVWCGILLLCIPNEQKSQSHMVRDLTRARSIYYNSKVFDMMRRGIAVTSLSSEQFCVRLLNEDHISTTPGSGYGASCDRYIRIAIGAEPLENIKKALVTIKRCIMEK